MHGKSISTVISVKLQPSCMRSQRNLKLLVPMQFKREYVCFTISVTCTLFVWNKNLYISVLRVEHLKSFKGYNLNQNSLIQHLREKLTIGISSQEVIQNMRCPDLSEIYKCMVCKSFVQFLSWPQHNLRKWANVMVSCLHLMLV